MKYFMSILYYSFLSCSSLAVSKNDIPQIHFYASPLFDFVCEKQTKYQIDQLWKTELDSIIPDLVSNWNSKGTRLLSTSQKLAGYVFERKEYDVTLTVCSFPSMSHPILINMRQSLKSFTSEQIPMHVTLGIIHHEILHHYLLGKIPKTSKLLEKYKDEVPRVKIHLHLLALQQATYIDLNLEKELADIIAKDELLPPGLYKRAWEIVKTEGYKSFVDEIYTSKK